MTSKKDKQRMKDYIVSRLEKEYPHLDVRTKELVPQIKSTYIFTANNSDNVVFLLDQEYPAERFNTLFKRFHNNGVNVTSVFLKDSKTFFRSGSEKYYYKKKKGFGLKAYSNEDMRRMIFFRPEEIFVNSMKQYLQYYQPESSRLEEGIETFEFKPAFSNYSHIEKDRFRPLDRELKRLHIWIDRIHRKEDLKVHPTSYLVKKN